MSFNEMKFVLSVLLLVACAQASVRPPHPALRSQDDSQKGMDTRIKYGQKAKDGQFPWHVQLDVFTSGSPRWACAGALISDQWVLTVAYCYGPVESIEKIHIGIGGVKRGEFEYNADSTVLIINKKSETQVGYNIGLVKMPFPVYYTETIRPVQLASRNHPTVAGAVLLFSGFGTDETGSYSQYLKFMPVLGMHNEECSKINGGPIPDTNICALGHGPQSACGGDSGGPLIDNRQGTILVGLVDRVNCENSKTHTFTSVVSHLDWIHEHTGIEIY